MTERYLAHVRKDSQGKWEEHGLEQHLNDVAKMSESFASAFGSSDWASLAGLWHDLGKYKPDFQSYIRSASGYDAHLEGTTGKVDHSTAGAIHAIQRHPQIGRILAYLIAGHHSGLPDWFKVEAEGRGLAERVAETRHLDDAKKADIPPHILDSNLPESSPPSNPEHAHLWIRILFSCLVDADFLDTEAFMDSEKTRLRGVGGSVELLQTKFVSKMEARDSAIRARGEFDSPVNRIRREVLEDCRKAADLSPGFFSLTVPTGGGKTLSSMAFALKHAVQHQKRRIILAIPFTSIIEQSAQILTDIFGAKNVLEHHSNLDLDRETPRGRLAAENWDAPVVVTTNAQLFESLFASRTSRCRRLHNLAESVIILDEAQMLPPEFLAPTLSVLKGLVGHFGCSVVLCTATQPALVGKIGSQSAAFPGLDPSSVREIVREPMALADSLRRVSVRFLGPQKVEWHELAKPLSGHDQVLCIVNRRRDCRVLWEALKNESGEVPVHLSALMCGEHRSGVIRQIKDSLAGGRRIRVVSTQLVEAGVDIDFPVVYRAMTGLDGIAQAAGRCNREGKLDVRLGETVVFNPPEGSPPGLLRKREQAGFEALRNLPDADRLLSPEGYNLYFRCLFRGINDFGWESFKRYFTKDVGAGQFQFRSAAQWFRLIDEAGTKSIIVWYEQDRFSSRAMLEEVRRLGPSRNRLRTLQRATVTVPERVWSLLRDQGSIAELEGPEGRMGLWAQCAPGLYDPIFGLKMEGPELSGQEFIC
jgi:CRISPR-associated endonuclease/helicase Cas3